ncbi:MAG: TolC family protein [Bacteroidales bacterium]|jgi:outer membrane protein TolC|nr:TolC family protein [Bacteroidales bacterium]
MKKSVIIPSVIFALAVSPKTCGQTSLTLLECVQMAVEQNISVDKARLEKEKSAYKITETRSSYLPQISGSGSFQNNVKLPVTMLPGDFLGQSGLYIPMKMGIRYNASVGVAVNQVLYNQTVIAGVKLSKKADGLNALNMEKTRENLAQEIARLYFLAQTTDRQKELVSDNIARLERLAGISKLVVDNGMGVSVDYDRIQVNLENLHTELSNTEAMHQQQLNMIKYMIEIPLETAIVLTDTVSMPLLASAPVSMSDFSNRTDIRMLAMQQDIAQMNLKMERSKYLPSLAAFGQWNYAGMRNKFGDYFKGGPMSNWYSSAAIGLSLNIPIFNGLEKRSKVQQAKIDYRQSTLMLDNTQEYHRVNYKNAMNNYFNSRNNVERQAQNMKLAERVYHETALKYHEGMATMSGLLQDEAGLSSAQAGYLNALYQFKVAELDIMQLNGEIGNLMTNSTQAAQGKQAAPVTQDKADLVLVESLMY